MNELKRYDFYSDGDCINDGGCGSRVESKHGEYVDYSEAAALMDEKDKQIERLRKLLYAEIKSRDAAAGREIIACVELEKAKADNLRMRDAIVKLQAAADPNPTIVSIVKQALAATAQGNERK